MAFFTWRLLESNGKIYEKIEKTNEGVEESTVIRDEQDYELLEENDENKEIIEDETEISHVIPDAVLCQEMRRLWSNSRADFSEESKRKIDLLLQYNYLIKEYVHCRKKVLSAINETKAYKSEEANKYQLVDALIEDCRRRISSREFFVKYASLYNDVSLERILKRIEDKLEKGVVPYYWLEKLVKALDGTVAKRREIVKLLQDSVKYQPSREKPLTAQMIINSDLYESYTNMAKQVHIENTEDMMNCLESLSVEYPQSFQTRIEEMRGYINRCLEDGPNVYVLDGYCDAGKACYGLLQYGMNDYFALSGSFDFEEVEIRDYYRFKPSTLEKYEILKSNVTLFHTSCYPNAVWAKMRLTTKRYPYPGEWGERIPSEGETFSAAMIRSTDEAYVKEVKQGFTCCERKIFEYLSGDSQGKVYLFSKYRPCKKCRPAIRKFRKNERGIRVFFIGENGVEEWKDQGEDRELVLDQEYEKIKERLRKKALKGN